MEGNQIVLLLLKLFSQLANRISQIIARAGIGYLKHRQRKRDLGLKKGKVLKTDKIELLIAKNIKRTLVVYEKNFDEKSRVSKFKLDCYKLERQSELADFEKNIKVLTSGIDTTKNQITKDMMQKELYKTIHEKTDFEKEVNKNLLHMNKEINTLESDHIHTKENIKICNNAIDGFASDRARDMTESTRSDFESLVKEESMSYSKKSLEHDKNIKKQEVEMEVNKIHKKPVIEVNKEPGIEINKKPPIEINKEPGIDINKKPAIEIDKKPIIEINKESEIEINKESEIEIDKKPVIEVNKESEIEIEQVKEPVTTEKIKDDEFTKTYLEKQRRRSLSKDHQKDLGIER